MENLLTDIWIVEERRTRNTHAVCFSLKEAEDAYKYLTECIGWPNDAFCIREATAYPNGWHRELIEANQAADAHDDADDYLISDDLLDEANDHYNHFV